MKTGKEKALRRLFVFTFLMTVPVPDEKKGFEILELRRFMPLCEKHGYTPVMMLPFPRPNVGPDPLTPLKEIMLEAEKHPSLVVCDSSRAAEALPQEIPFWEKSLFHKHDDEFLRCLTWRAMMSGKPAVLSAKGEGVYDPRSKHPARTRELFGLSNFLTLKQFHQTAKLVHSHVPK